MSNVVSIAGDPVTTTAGEPVEGVVTALREALAEAESGNLRAVAISGVIVDGTKTSMSAYWCDWEVGRLVSLHYAASKTMRLVEKACDDD